MPRNPRAVSKPCARSECAGRVFANGPKTLATKKYCSHRCSMLERIARGEILTEAWHRAGGRAAGKVMGARWRKEAAVRAANRAEVWLGIDRGWFNALTRDDRARLRAVPARVDREAYRRGYDAGYNAGARRRAA